VGEAEQHGHDEADSDDPREDPLHHHDRRVAPHRDYHCEPDHDDKGNDCLDVARPQAQLAEDLDEGECPYNGVDGLPPDHR
jgi:hypothetical protein